jgi:hypothetical protein
MGAENVRGSSLLNDCHGKETGASRGEGGNAAGSPH